MHILYVENSSKKCTRITKHATDSPKYDSLVLTMTFDLQYRLFQIKFIHMQLTTLQNYDEIHLKLKEVD